MNRRKFIQKTSLALASISISNIAFAQESKPVLLILESKNYFNAEQDHYFRVDLYPESILNYKNVKNELKSMSFLEYKHDSTENKDILLFDAKYNITSVEQNSTYKNEYKIEASLVKKIKENGDSPKKLNLKKLKFSFVKGESGEAHVLTLIDKEGLKNAVLKNDISGEDHAYDDCFLTTACVKIMGKPDDCIELTTLRHFRDTHLLTTEEGKKLVDEYYHIAPKIIEQINLTKEQEVIYKNIYLNMIVPTINAINLHQPALAINTYRDYTIFLQSQFLNH
jgi:hypothetical protein